ncbi:crooked neck-like protein 1 [Petromyzon marinus]|uniref:Crooked neck-like protein 1 n=1 Tax=Petromyzon marinus TaxID=7757 RepID=A0AAJ7TJ93_PETMA|nr:crooked neck-like protein 1 [Petromyzon marinus]
MASTAAGKQRIPKVAKVKNKAPADLQITAEQLLREAKERELELLPPPPRQKISDEEELADYKLRKRKTFEDNIRKNRTVVTNWIKYAQWEESLKEIQRARSLYERALDVDHRNVTLWLKYAEMEMKNRQVNHARNIWDRAVTILPRINAFWYKYTYMEEMLSNVAGCRQVFERWMEWEPEEQAWHSYINFELRYKEVDAARAVYEKFVMVHPEIKNWIKYARFEDRHGYTAHARRVYERAVEFYGEEHMKEPLFVAFARFEEAQKEFDRVRVIYKYALDRIPKQSSQELFKNYTMFEKKYGDRRGIEDVIVSKRRFQYEEEVKANPHNYDAWFDYLRLVESDCEVESVREVYERAIANVPLLPEKRHWRRYIYLWINFALFEELEMKDPDRTRQVYQGCLELIPHKKFTFSKIWLLFAQFEIRQKNLTAARKILGMSIGKCPKNKLFKGYIELELQLREFDRCRKLYEKFLEFAPENCTTWMKFAELETILGDVERSRAIYELAVGQPRLDMPEVLWKSYIDFEIEQEECSRTRNLYRRLLQRTQHVKVWISFAKFELSVEGKERVSRCRRVYEEGNRSLRSCEEKEERVMLLEAWRDFEDPFGNEDSRERVQKLMPSRVKKRRKVQTDDGSDAGWEEYYDYIFPEDSANQPNLKLLSMAKMWKQHQYMEAHGIASTAQGAPQWVDEPVEEDEQRDSDAQTSVQRQPGNEKGTVTARDTSDEDDGGDGREERESVATGEGDSGSVNEEEGESSGETSKKTPIDMEVGGGDDELVSKKAIKKEQENIGDRDPDKDRDETEDS